MSQSLRKTAIIAICQTPTLVRKAQVLEEVNQMFKV